MPRRSALRQAIREAMADGGLYTVNDLMRSTRSVVLVGEALRAREHQNVRIRHLHSWDESKRDTPPLWRQYDIGQRILVQKALNNMLKDKLVDHTSEGWRLLDQPQGGAP